MATVHLKGRFGGKPNKYRNKITVIDGEKFHSQKEAKRHQELLLLQRGNLIRNLERQPRFVLIVKGEEIGTYVGDWLYHEVRSDGTTRIVCEDAKGFPTPEYKLKIKLAKVLYPDVDFLES